MVGLIRVYLKGYTVIGGLRKYLFEIDWTIEKGKFAYQLKKLHFAEETLDKP